MSIISRNMTKQNTVFDRAGRMVLESGKRRSCIKRAASTLFAIVSVCSMLCVSAFAEEAAVVEETAADSSGMKALAAAIVVGLAATAGAIAMGMAIAKSAESMARQPEVSGKINSTMMLGLVFIETAIIYALIVAILIIFVL